ncbi:hypothetical protein [Ferrimonas marina]|nr:hypothetical protein [Ferrimonas marina]
MKKHVIDLLAVAIAACALLVSVLSYTLTQAGLDASLEANRLSQQSLKSVLEHNEKSVTPKLEFRLKLSIGANSGGFVKIKNAGYGPAELVEVQATYKGERISTDANTLSQIASGLHMTGHSISPGALIGPQESITLYDIPARSYKSEDICPKDQARKALVEDLRIRVIYKSLYDRQDETTLEYTSTNQLNC